MARRIIEPPRLRIGEAGERHATWMELFFDLVFVVAVSQLADRLLHQTTIVGVLEFLLLFAPVWWAWIGAAFYSDRFGTDDLSDRLFLLAQMATAAGLAINAGQAFRERSINFALSYAAFRYLLVAQYARAGRFVPQARPFTRPLVRRFGLSATLWVASVFVPPPVRFIFWGVGMMADFATPVSTGRAQSRLAPHPTHLPERLGLFLIIVLGESVGAVVIGLQGVQWVWFNVVIVLLGLVLAFSFWWIYFEGLDASAIRRALQAGRPGVYEYWIYAHFPLTAAVAVTGVGVRLAIRAVSRTALPSAERWLVCGATGIYFASLGAMYIAQAVAGSRRCTVRAAVALGAGTLATLLIGALGARLTPAGVLALLAGVGTLLIVRDLVEGSPRS